MIRRSFHSSPQKFSLLYFLFLSIFLHGLVLCFFIFIQGRHLQHWGELQMSEEVTVFVDLGTGNEPTRGASQQKQTPSPRSSEPVPKKTPEKSQKIFKTQESDKKGKSIAKTTQQTQTPTSGGGGDKTSEGKGGPPSGGGKPGALQLIRRQIERAKRYPQAARERGIEGTVQLRFEIAPSGTLKSLSLLHSSGSKVLDDEAMATIRRAQPFPYYAGPISMPLRFNLDRE